MLGLRQSLVTSGKIGIQGGQGFTPIDIGPLGSAQDGNTVLLYEQENINVNLNTSYAYTVIRGIVGYLPPTSNSSNISYGTSWDAAAGFAHSVILASQKGTEVAKFVGSNEYDGMGSYTLDNPDPRFKIYPNLTFGNTVIDNIVEIKSGVYVAKNPTTFQYEDLDIITNPATYLIKKWWRQYFIDQNDQIEYSGAKYIWGPKEHPSSAYAYALNVYTGAEELRPITEGNSFLLFRSIAYSTVAVTTSIQDEYQAQMVGASAPTGYSTRGLETQIGAPALTPTYANKLYLPNSGSKLYEFEIEFDAIAEDAVINGVNQKRNLNIQPPFNGLKKVTFPDGTTRIDLSQDPGLEILVDMFYYYTPNNSQTRVTNVVQGLTTTVIPYRTGQNLQYPEFIVSTNAAGVPKVKYIYKYRLTLSGIPGFLETSSPDIIGPIGLFNFRLKVPNQKFSTPFNLGRYAVKNIPLAPTFSFPFNVPATANIYTINCTADQLLAAAASNPNLSSRFQGIINGQQL